MNIPPNFLSVSYDTSLVVLSVAVAIMTSYLAFEFARNVATTHDKSSYYWLGSGALVMGAGIWSMHFIGMLAFSLPIPVHYHAPTVVLSYLAAVVASGGALLVVGKLTLGLIPLVRGGILMGLGITAMHYTGMAAMRMQAMIRYDAVLLTLAVVTAMGLSVVGLWIVFRLRDEVAVAGVLKKLGGAVVMGSAISTMHYIGMASASFYAIKTSLAVSPFVIDGAVLGHSAILFIGILLILGLALTSVFAAHSSTMQTKELQQATRRLAQESAERVDLEKTLVRFTNQYELILDSVGEGIYVVDVEGKTTFVNPAGAKMLGWEVDEIIGKDQHAIFFHSYADGMLYPQETSPIFSTFKHGVAYATDSDVFWRKDGTSIPVEYTSTPIWEHGALAGAVVSFRDVSERIQLEDKFSRVVESVPIGMIMVNRGGSVVLVNAMAENLFGYRREELLGKSIDMLLPEQFRQQHPEQRASFMADPVVRPMGVSRHLYGLRKDGTEFPIEISLTPVEISEGPAVLSAIVDITQRKEMQLNLLRLNASLDEKVRQRTAELQAKNVELEQFAYTISHDLKSPLISIRGFIGLLEKDAIDGNVEDMKRDIHRIIEATEKMKRLMDDLLELSKIGLVANQPVEVALSDVVDDALDRVDGAIKARGVKVDIASDLPVVFGDRTRLVQVVQNLLDNAIKFMGDQLHPHIEITVRQDGKESIVVVGDNGMGIEPQYQEKVFGLFDRLDQKVEGTGIGLAIVKRIIEGQGGRIWVESEGKGKGSTFCFVFPKAVTEVET